MKVNYTSNGKTVIEYSLTEVKHMAGVGYNDPELAADYKIADWIGDRKVWCVTYDTATYAQDIEAAGANDVEILIFITEDVVH